MTWAVAEKGACEDRTDALLPSLGSIPELFFYSACSSAFISTFFSFCRLAFCHPPFFARWCYHQKANRARTACHARSLQHGKYWRTEYQQSECWRKGDYMHKHKKKGRSRADRQEEKEETDRNRQTLSSVPPGFWPVASSSINSTQEKGEGGKENMGGKRRGRDEYIRSRWWGNELQEDAASTTHRTGEEG